MKNLRHNVLTIPWMGDIIEKYQLGNHHAKAADVAKALKLTATFEFISTYHEFLHKEVLYHGLKHSIITFMNAVEGGVIAGVPDSELRCLAIAALFHDLGHSCGGKTDKYNITTAVAAFRSNRGINPELFDLTDEEANSITRCIQATFYPWKEYAELSECAKILRDADMMSAYIDCPSTLKELFTGLMNEISLKRFPYEIRDFLADQDKFRNSLVWNTRWGKLKALQLNWPGRFNYIKHVMQGA